jgi:uncharacterized membrane protein HdeD (DUF308 family)
MSGLLGGDPERVTGFGPIDIDPVQRNSGWFIGLGVAFVVLGVFAMLLPFVAGLATTIALGWLIIVAGAVEGYHAVQNRRWGGWGWELVSALVQVVAGILVVAFPMLGKLALTLTLAVYFLAQGGLKIIRALQHRRVQGSGWLVFDGLLSLLLGVLILWHWPSAALWALGLFVGVSLLMGGSSMLLIGLGARPGARV